MSLDRKLNEIFSLLFFVFISNLQLITFTHYSLTLNQCQPYHSVIDNELQINNSIIHNSIRPTSILITCTHESCLDNLSMCIFPFFHSRERCAISWIQMKVIISPSMVYITASHVTTSINLKLRIEEKNHSPRGPKILWSYKYNISSYFTYVLTTS